jgi:methyl-accepting chemotaxis protein
MEMRQAILDGLPEFMERIDEATQKIYDPSQVWFESIQFADYVEQLAEHLAQDHGPECREEIATQLRLMSESWKDLAENAMEVLDKSEEVFKHNAQ